MTQTIKKAVGIAGVIAALGVVFGDIGTSPLYAMGLLFSPDATHYVDPTPDNVFGILSVVIWLVTLVVTLKYATFILRADNHGEGGTVALLSLLREKLTNGRTIAAVTVIGLAGMALFLGDAVITPAISVLSAVEGVEVVAPGFAPYVVPVVLVILVGLFAVQRAGTATIGRLFGPAMSVWFSVLALMGIYQIQSNPSVLKAINPWYAVKFIGSEPLLFFAVLSILLLTITGVEALFADLGHFRRPVIMRAWICAAFPALMLNYFGQGALLLKDGPVDNLFFAMVPPALVVPLVVVATIATVIAAQAVISGAFSLVAQATKLSYLPRTQLRYPSGQHGQVYVPFINWTLFVVVSAIVIAFGASESLADAYGITVVGCLVAATVRVQTLVRKVWLKPMWMVLAGALVFGVIDIALLLSCLPKITSGGWFPLMLAALMFTLLWTWSTARTYLKASRAVSEGDLADFIAQINSGPVERLPSTAVYLHPNKNTVPISMRTVYELFSAVHQYTLIVSINITDNPTVAADQRATLDDLLYDDGIWHVTLNYGFNEVINIPQALTQVVSDNPSKFAGFDIPNATYLVSKFETDHVDIPALAKPLERIYVAMKDSETDPVAFYGLPLDRAVTLGTHMA